MAEYKNHGTVDDFGMTDAEWAAMFEAMTPEEREALLKFYGLVEVQMKVIILPQSREQFHIIMIVVQLNRFLVL